MTYKTMLSCNICGYRSESLKEFISVNEKLVVELGVEGETVQTETEVYMGYMKANKHLCYKCFSSVLEHLSDAVERERSVSPKLTVRFTEMEVER